MDPQDKKSKDWSLFGKAEDRAIAKAKYKREMGINPLYKIEQNAEASRRSQSMKNPTDRPYDAKTSPKGLKKAEVIGAGSDSKFENSKKNPVRKAQYNRGYVPWVVEATKDAVSPSKFRKQASGTYTKPYDVKKLSSSESSEQPASSGRGVKAATDKSRAAPKMTNFQRMKAAQFEKEGVAGRSVTRSQAKKLATKPSSNTPSLMILFGISKTPKATPKKTSSTRTGPLKSAFAQISYQGRKK